MKKIFITVCLIITANVYAEFIVDEALYASTKSQGSAIYYMCIVVPPVTPHQLAVCGSMYAGYMSSLTELNLPYPLITSLDPDPYAWSPFDVCRTETEHMIFGDQGVQPYCPTI